MKQCSKCGDMLPSLEFYGDKRATDGLYSQCKLCSNRATKAYENKHREQLNQWRKVWDRTPKGRDSRRQNCLRQKEKFPERIRAREAIHTARRYGKLIPGPCAECGSTDKIEAHHHEGYKKEHWLDIRWLCREHHRAAN